jgi:hypothetical protein
VKGECYYNKFHPTKPQCPETDVYLSPNMTGTFVDDWTWCAKHLPPRRLDVPERRPHDPFE